MSSRGDRYSRRDERGDRYGTSSSTTGGRYAPANSTRDRERDREDRYERRRRGGRSRSGSAESSASSHTREDGGRVKRQRTRFEATPMDAASYQQPPSGYPMYPQQYPPYQQASLQSMMMMGGLEGMYAPPYQQQQQPGGAFFSVPPPPPPGGYGMTVQGGSSGGYTPQQLLEILQKQQQQQAGGGTSARTAVDAAAASEDGKTAEERDQTTTTTSPPPPPVPLVPTRAVPSVEDFIPTVPKSLLGLIGKQADGAATSSSTAAVVVATGGDEGSGGMNENNVEGVPVGGEGADASTPAAPENTQGGGGTMILLEAPKIAPGIERRCREGRRAHVSGFPPVTTREELLDYFRVLIPEVRRSKTQREVNELTLSLDHVDGEAEEPPVISANARTDLDQIKDITVKMSKSKWFAFIELSYADMITEMVSESEKDPEHFIFTAADGCAYPLMVRRPRDFDPLVGVDETKVVMLGFPPSLPHDKLRALFEQFGELGKFEVIDGVAYAEYEDAKHALDCRMDMHGQVLGGRVVVVFPLFDWLKVLCHHTGIDVTVEETDPISGSYVMQRIRSEAAAGNGGGGSGGGGGILEGGFAFGGAGAAGSSALVLAPEKPDHMREILDLSSPIPEVVFRLCKTYPHLRPLYGSHQVAIFATRVLALFNLFDKEELTLDTTYSTLLADIEQEVEKYGRVEELIVPRREAAPRAPEIPRRKVKQQQQQQDNAGEDGSDVVDAEEDEETAFQTAIAGYKIAQASFARELDLYMERQIHPVWGGYGNVYVKYETVDEAAHAQQQIAGKLFGGRTVVTSFVFEDVLRKPGEVGPEEEEEEADEEEGGEQVMKAAHESSSGLSLDEDAIHKDDVDLDEDVMATDELD